MKIEQFGHIAFNCRNTEKSVEFYRDIIGCKEKFTLNFDSFIETVKRSGKKVPNIVYKLLEKRKDKIWITYLEYTDGVYIELFDQIGALISNRPVFFKNNYQHFAIIVDDIEKTKNDLLAKGVKIDIDINLGLDYTYQMWIHDPDGNKIEIMQYTDRSLQLSK